MSTDAQVGAYSPNPYHRELVNRQVAMGFWYVKERHQVQLCQCSFCHKIRDGKSETRVRLWAPARKYWFAGWWTLVNISLPYVIYRRVTLMNKWWTLRGTDV